MEVIDSMNGGNISLREKINYASCRVKEDAQGLHYIMMAYHKGNYNMINK